MAVWGHSSQDTDWEQLLVDTLPLRDLALLSVNHRLHEAVNLRTVATAAYLLMSCMDRWREHTRHCIYTRDTVRDMIARTLVRPRVNSWRRRLHHEDDPVLFS